MPEVVREAHSRVRNAQLASEERARQFLATAPRCDVCGQQMAFRGRPRHFLCEQDAMEGKVCICPPDCTKDRWGDGARRCDPECVPCRIMRGRVYEPPRKRPEST